MAKIMIFIDGTWLYSNTPRLAEAYGDSNFRVDFGKLPHVLADVVSEKLGMTKVDVVRTYLFGSYAINFDYRDEDAVARRREFFDVLKEEYHYEVEIYPINFCSRRLRRADRDPSDTFEPREKCVDISLATTMLYLAAIPYAYDIAIAVIGDRDFTPMLQNVRRLGKRVAIASIKTSCAPEFYDPRDEARVKDFDIIWIDDLLHRLELKYERIQRQCESLTHKGNPAVWTTYLPRKGTKFYCEDCRKEFNRQKRENENQFVNMGSADDLNSPSNDIRQTCLNGIIKPIIDGRAFGFIAADDGKDYYFHHTDLIGSELSELKGKDRVIFEIKRQPSNDKAGAAQNVRLLVD